jgi:hypothetical protein
MATAATVVVVLALIGAVVSWIAGAIFYARTLSTLAKEGAPTKLRWLAVFGWLFAVGRMQGAAAEHAAKVNKAIVAFMVCVMVAATAIALATNLQRIAK